jgi:hypothetical protein
MDDCELIADVVTVALPWIDKELSTLAWEPIAFCATFVPVCSIPCCDTNSDPEQA